MSRKRADKTPVSPEPIEAVESALGVRGTDWAAGESLVYRGQHQAWTLVEGKHGRYLYVRAATEEFAARSLLRLATAPPKRRNRSVRPDTCTHAAMVPGAPADQPCPNCGVIVEGQP